MYAVSGKACEWNTVLIVAQDMLYAACLAMNNEYESD